MKFSLILLLTAAVVVGCAGADPDSPENPEDKVILVTGATGTQGGAVARELLNRGYAVRGLTRNSQSDRAKATSKIGVEMVQGDFDDAASLAAAMDGVHGVFAVTDFWEHGYDKEIRHGKQLVDAALAASVEHFVFTSVASADEDTGIPHFESKCKIEIYLRDSGIGFSIVRPVEFMDNVRYFREGILSGVYFDPRDPGRSHQWIAASDIAYLVGEAFDNPAEWLGQAVDIAGDQLTIAEFVDALSRAAEVDIRYQKLTWAEYQAQSGEEMTAMLRWFDDIGYQVDIAALRGRYPKLLTYEQYLEKLDWD
ncbi:MAG: NmrA/HSCARG family protein [Gammaproteobacteria bacterium]|nr:NmrA/HSCARG family protein [Gammaproteobacteria bacterium]